MATKTKKSTKAPIRPLGDKVLLVRDEAESITEAGIFLPEQAQDTPKSGRVVAVGHGALNTDTGERTPLTLKAGDRVLFTSYAGTEVKLADEEYMMMSESEILAVFED